MPISVFIPTKIILCDEADVHICKSFVLGLHVEKSVLEGQSAEHREKNATCSPAVP